MDIVSLSAGLVLGGLAGGTAIYLRLAARQQQQSQENWQLQAELTRAQDAVAQQKRALDETRQQMSDHFKALSADIARDSQKNFLTLAEVLTFRN